MYVYNYRLYDRFRRPLVSRRRSATSGRNGGRIGSLTSWGLQFKFGAAGLDFAPAIENIADLEALRTLHETILSGVTLDDLHTRLPGLPSWGGCLSDSEGRDP